MNRTETEIGNEIVTEIELKLGKKMDMKLKNCQLEDLLNPRQPHKSKDRIMLELIIVLSILAVVSVYCYFHFINSPYQIIDQTMNPITSNNEYQLIIRKLSYRKMPISTTVEISTNKITNRYKFELNGKWERL